MCSEGEGEEQAGFADRVRGKLPESGAGFLGAD